MPKVASVITSQIGQLTKKELEKLVLKAAAKDKTFHDYLLVNYFEKEQGEQDLFEQAKEELEILFRKNYKGFSEELQLANMLAACIKRINEFSKICKNKNLEADLIVQVLEIPFSLSTNIFCTCFTAFNYKVVLLMKRIINLLKNKMHEDYLIQYRKKINEYLNILHRTSDYLDYVNALPQYI
jgi:hypothetical protein